jgi:hypothetical protein
MNGLVFVGINYKLDTGVKWFEYFIKGGDVGFLDLDERFIETPPAMVQNLGLGFETGFLDSTLVIFFLQFLQKLIGKLLVVKPQRIRIRLEFLNVLLQVGAQGLISCVQNVICFFVSDVLVKLLQKKLRLLFDNFLCSFELFTVKLL